MMQRRLGRMLGLAGLVLSGMLAQGIGAAELPRVSGPLKELQTALARYQDPIQAVHDGYLSTLGCVMMPKGGMGIHFVNLRLIGPKVHPMKPNILMYEPVGDKLKLVAVEWLVPYVPGKSKRPSLFGQEFHGPMEGHEPLLPKGLHHYDFHVWLFKENPKGMFADANPRVKCAGKTNYTVHEKPTRMVKH